MSTNETYTPALGRRELTGLYDAAIALMTRERRWRSALLKQLAPRAGETILDVGCGTGSLALLIVKLAPGVHVVGLDPDAEVLERARRKLAGSNVKLAQGFAHAADAAGIGPVDKVVSSLVFHQTPMAEKRAGLEAMFRALSPGGEVHIADYGLQRTPLMRRLFRQVQRLDGFENTEPNARGVLPDLMREAGFADVAERAVIPTPTGSISLYSGLRQD
jgi:ubiquinone/menaquinone biosynthesis C-methylase UbiE